MFRMRAHHLLCLLAFQGKGYSQAFIERMNELKSRYLMDEPFILVDGSDSGCEQCPHYLITPEERSDLPPIQAEPGQWPTGKRPSGEYPLPRCTLDGVPPEVLDGRVLSRLDLVIGQSLTFRQIWPKLCGLSIEEIFSMCDGCDWLHHTHCAQIVHGVLRRIESRLGDSILG